jgi:hypothetical protein
MDYRAEKGDIVPLLYQTGYLTIKNYKSMTDTYILGFPNEEVKYGFFSELLMLYADTTQATFYYGNFTRDLLDGNLDNFMLRLQAFFANIPFDLNNKTEKDWQTTFYLLLSLMGRFIKVEEHSAAGSSDAVIETSNNIYIFELKMDGAGTVEDALKQIEEKNYAGKYAMDKRPVTKVGVVFDNEKRTIGAWSKS